MKLGVLFSGGKDSTLAMYLAKKSGYAVSCLISIISENKDSFMFHTPSISQVKKQAEQMSIPLIVKKSYWILRNASKKHRRNIILKGLSLALLEVFIRHHASKKYAISLISSALTRYGRKSSTKFLMT